MGSSSCEPDYPLHQVPCQDLADTIGGPWNEDAHHRRDATRFRDVREVGRALGIVLGIVGIIWILQGFDFYFAPESFMTGDRAWVIWGALALLAGGSLIWKGNSRK